MEYGYCRVSTRGQLDGNSIEEQQKMIDILDKELKDLISTLEDKELPFN